MVTHRSVLLAILRKDLRIFRYSAGLIAGLLALWQFPGIASSLGEFSGPVAVVIQLATLVLIQQVIHEDAIASLQHDWLTRPVPGLALLSAKVAFVGLIVFMPACVGSVTHGLMQGESAAEAVLTGAASVFRGDFITVIAMVMALAATTTGMRQGLTATLAAVVLAMLLFVLIERTTGLDESLAETGSVWVLIFTLQTIVLLTSLAVLWIQYGYRNTRAALVTIAVAVSLGTLLLTTLNWSRIASIQQWFSPQPKAADIAQLELAPVCFPANNAGDSIRFRTSASQRPTVAAHRLVVNLVALRYVSADRTLQDLSPVRTSVHWTVRDSDTPTITHDWAMSKTDLDGLATRPNVQTRLEYWLSLLAPAATATLPTDGSRAYYSGLGYCSATPDIAAGRMTVECFKAVAPPALLVAAPEGAPDLAGASSTPDYTPALLALWGRRHYAIQMPILQVMPQRVHVTAFSVQSHFRQQFDVSGVLGGPATTCPDQ